MSDGLIVVDRLAKHYGDVRAVDDLSFIVEPGRVTGFLGPNGAGKTTTLRMIVNLITPTAGTATIGGDRYADLPDPVRHVGAILEASAAHKGRTGRNHLRVICEAAGLPQSRADEVLELVGLTAAGDRKFKGYSLGMRQRLGIAAAMIGDPQVLILDEPANGLDPEGIRWMRDLLKSLAAEGRTILVSSHLLTEMEILADDLVIIASGQLVTQGTVASIVESMAHTGRTLVRTPDVDTLTEALLADGTATVTEAPDGGLYVTGPDAAGIGTVAQRAGVVLHQLTSQRPDLEEVFLELTKGKAGHPMTVTSATAPYADAPGSEDPGTATLHAAPAGRKHLIRAEILKIRTTNTWWLFGIALVVVTGLALTSNGFNHHYELYPHFDGGGRHDHESQAQMLAMRDAARSPAGLKMIAADMVTSGQFFGVLFALLLGALVVTNEFYHQTATATFMTSPRRTSVIAAKLVAATSFGVLFWLITTVISLVVTPIFMHSQHVAVSLDNWVVTRSVLLNLLAYVMWAILGLGLGTLIRSQIGTVVTGMAVYFIGFAAVEVIFHLLYNLYPHNWILAMPVIAPSVAALVMTTPGHAFDNAPAQWVGLLVMIGYTLIFGGIGVWLTRRRDIS